MRSESSFCLCVSVSAACDQPREREARPTQQSIIIIIIIIFSDCDQLFAAVVCRRALAPYNRSLQMINLHNQKRVEQLPPRRQPRRLCLHLSRQRNEYE